MLYLKRLVWSAVVAVAATAPGFAQQGTVITGGGGAIGNLSGTGGLTGGATGGGIGGGAGGGTGGGLGGSGTGGTALQGLPSPPTITAPGTTGSSGSSALSSSNFLGSTYANPYYQGILSNSSSSGNSPGGFGAPLYGTSGGAGGGSIGYAGGSSTTNGGGTRTGATGGVGGRSMGGTNGTSGGGILVALPVQINYRAVAHFPIAPVANNQLQADLSGMLARSTMIANPASVQVVAAGNTVTLRGIVKDEEEARLIESMVRLTPGVRSLNNELSFPKP